MSLFKYLKDKKPVNIDPLFCPTPLGHVLFQLEVNNQEAIGQPIKRSITEDNAFILKWNFKECEIEFFRAAFVPQIPLNEKIDCCVAGIWRVKSLDNNLKLNFQILFQPQSKAEITTRVVTGEGIISCLYENNATLLSIGTEDEEYLASRAHVQNWMPSRLEAIFSNTSVIESNINGLQITAPPLEINEVFQIQFILAWSSQPCSTSSTWFAVDQRASYILNQFGII